MNRIDPTVKRETCFIAGCVIVLSVIMELTFLLLGAWDSTVLWGNLLGGFAAVLNFLLMGLTIQSALGKGEEEAKTKMKLSQKLRMLLLVVICAVAAALPVFNLVATLVPQLFPRIGVMLRPTLSRKAKA